MRAVRPHRRRSRHPRAADLLRRVEEMFAREEVVVVGPDAGRRLLDLRRLIRAYPGVLPPSPLVPRP